MRRNKVLAARGLAVGGILAGIVGSGGMAHAITSTSALPKGVRAFAFVHGRSFAIDASLNANGNLEPLAQSLNRTLTMEDFTKSGESGAQLKKLQNVLNEMTPGNLGDQLLSAQLYSSISVEERRNVGALFWGLSNRLSIGVVIPRVERKINAEFRADVSNNADRIHAAVGSVPQIDEGLTQLARTRIDTQTFEQAVFKDNGYLPLGNFIATGLGDIETEVRYTYFESPLADLALRWTVKSPTATHVPDIHNLLDRPLGSGDFNFKLGTLHTIKLVPGVLAFQSAIFGTWHAPSRQTLAVPLTPAADLANLNDPLQIEELRRQLGSQLDLDTGFELTLWKGVSTLYASYQQMAKAQDRYAGDRGLDYARLEKGTASIERSMEFALEFSSIPLFLSQKAPLPAKLVMTYHRMLSGENAPFASFGRVDAILLF